MYRNYENPYALERRLKELKEKLEECPSLVYDEDFAYTIAELNERIDQAWADEEYDSYEIWDY